MQFWLSVYITMIIGFKIKIADNHDLNPDIFGLKR